LPTNSRSRVLCSRNAAKRMRSGRWRSRASSSGPPFNFGLCC
jgi:hypothetical protein